MNAERVRFTVIEEKGIVKAEIFDCELDAIEAFDTKFMEHATSALALGIWDDCDSRFAMPYKFSVVAKKHPDDEWDEATGRRVAMRKLANKYNSSLDKHLLNIYKAMTKSMDKMYTYLVEHKMEV